MRWFKNYIFAKKCILISFWISNTTFIIPSHFIIVPYFTLWMLDFFNTICVSNSLDPDQARRFVGPDLGPNCFQRLSALLLLLTTKVDTSRQRVKYKTC